METDWYRWNERIGRWEFNHREQGWDESATRPIPKSRAQRNVWPKSAWMKEEHYKENTSE
jgi:hypothetical protein